MNLKKKTSALVVSLMMAAAAMGNCFAAPVGTINMPALLQQHPGYSKAMSQWQKDVQKAQKDAQEEYNKVAKTDTKGQQAVLEKYNTQLNKQRIALFLPLEKDILAKTDEVRKEKKLDNVVMQGSVFIGQYQDLTNDVAKKLK